MTNDTRPPVAPVEGFEWGEIPKMNPEGHELAAKVWNELYVEAVKNQEIQFQKYAAQLELLSDEIVALRALMPLADAACDYADQHCRWFNISTAPKVDRVFVSGGFLKTEIDGLTGDKIIEPTMVYGSNTYDFMICDTEVYDPYVHKPTKWRPVDAPSNPPLPDVFVQLGQALEKIKGA